MNGWDLFTWFNCAVLASAATIIFIFFLKDAKGILQMGDRREDNLDPSDPAPDAGPDRP
jgi:hypothetical protein